MSHTQARQLSDEHAGLVIWQSTDGLWYVYLNGTAVTSYRVAEVILFAREGVL